MNESESPESFRLDDEGRLHRFGDADCLGCERKPTPCTGPTCAGLVHSEARLFDDPYESNYPAHMEACDRCSGAPTKVWDDFDRLQEWNRQREAKNRLREAMDAYNESRRPATLQENVDAWVTGAEADLASCKSAANDAIRFSDSLWPDFPDVFLIRPGIRFVNYGQQENKRNEGKCDCLGVLFEHKDALQLAAGFELRLNQCPDNLASRAAAVALYCQLSRYVPGFVESGMSAESYELNEYIEEEYVVADESPEWTSRRTLYRGILAHVVRLLPAKTCTTWARIQWELVNCYAASDIWLARKLFDVAKEQQLCSAEALVLIRALSEFLFICGAEMDHHYGLGPAWTHRQGLREFSLEALNFLPFADLRSLTFEELRAILLWGVNRESVSLDVDDNEGLRWIVTNLPPILSSLDDDLKWVYSSLLAQSCEFTGEHELAAQYYDSLRGMMRGGHESALFAVAAARIYSQKLRNRERAEEILASVMDEEYLDFDAINELIQLQIGRGRLSAARATYARAVLAGCHESLPEHVKVLLSEPPDVLSVVEQRARTWPTFSQLSGASSEEWLWADYHRFKAQEHISLLDHSLRTAALYYVKSVEVDLREIVFRPFADSINRKRDRRPTLVKIRDDDERLYRFMSGRGPLTMGDMKVALERCGKLRDYVNAYMPLLLTPRILAEIDEIRSMGNQERHDRLHSSHAGTCEALARHVLESIHTPQ